jgi:hypothetical protein
MSAKDPAQILSLLMALIRSEQPAPSVTWGLMEEYRRCANSSAGSSGDPIGFLTPIPQSSQTAPTTQPTGTSVSVLHTEDEWWVKQNSDARYLAEMEDRLRQWEDDER